ncbi:peroxidase family protein, partial [Paracoccus sp. SY]|uniref:peroxidase family protein n=1 Tax=Paracoccus sp. SY TaxID=1330255 RepID=UPI0027389532
GYAQMVMEPDGTHATRWLKEGTAAGISTQGSVAAGPAFLDDIAHHAVPGMYDSDGDRIPDTLQTPDTDPGVGDDGLASTYDDEMLNSHFITGDGRGNENFGLSAVHSVFHAEHNRIVEENKHTILESNDLSFINEWLLVDITEIPDSQAEINALKWDGARLFQAARFSTEMQYQHMVFEEFARRIQPAVDPFVFTNTADIDPSIVAEFAHAIYRFGHSMLTDTVDRVDNNLNPINGPGGEQYSLIEAFLNPQAYMGTANNFNDIQGAILRGLSEDVGSEIDEFIVPALRSNLLGLPLDLAALNMARARETGVPSLNQTRDQLYNDFGVADLKPYESWSDFAQNLKNPVSLINFVAAYGTHATITGAATLEGKRAAATLLVLGGNGAPADRADFLNATGAYAGSASLANGRGGLNAVDLWIGGLAEKLNEFGGMLGSTFNFIFEYQMEQLQNGDRFYYLSRVQGLNLLDALEANSFADIMMRNSSMGDKYAPHMYAHAFLTPDMILELDRGIAQRDYNGNKAGNDPIWDDPLLQ